MIIQLQTMGLNNSLIYLRKKLRESKCLSYLKEHDRTLSPTNWQKDAGRIDFM
ncbi:hypothetical protein [Providencia rettgeri]|uniref:hypothetical protein n=1 Tax=Providencia rettgeri TaxID=587 RepID=UPI0013D903B6|nr:hypothetical protein [Providencia rettgeri]